MNQVATKPPRCSPTELGRRLLALREAKGMSLRQVAAALDNDLSGPAISQIETGWVKAPSVFRVARLARYYGTTVEQLLEGIDGADEQQAGPAPDQVA